MSQKFGKIVNIVIDKSRDFGVILHIGQAGWLKKQSNTACVKVPTCANAYLLAARLYLARITYRQHRIGRK